jgi:uncharacterized protein
MIRELQRVGKKAWSAAREILLPRAIPPQMVETGRIEIEREGKIAYLEYSLSKEVLELTHTEVPEQLRGLGLASSLADTALHWAQEKNLKVDVICPFVRAYVERHPQYHDLVMH